MVAKGNLDQDLLQWNRILGLSEDKAENSLQLQSRLYILRVLQAVRYTVHINLTMISQDLSMVFLSSSFSLLLCREVMDSAEASP